MAKLLWEPSEEQIKKTNMFRFMNFINETYNQKFDEYAPLYKWSVENIPEFWETFWKFADVIHSKPYDQVVDDVTKMPGASWFAGAPADELDHLTDAAAVRHYAGGSFVWTTGQKTSEVFGLVLFREGDLHLDLVTGFDADQLILKARNEAV